MTKRRCYLCGEECNGFVCRSCFTKGKRQARSAVMTAIRYG